MKAFVRRKHCGGCLTVRIGPDAAKDGDPWQRKLEATYQGKSATFEAYERGTRKLTPKMFEAAVQACFADGFDDVQLDRAGKNPRRLVFTKGENGAIRMSKVKKEKIAHISEIFKADGTLNVPVATFGLAHAMGQDAAGHISITDGVASETPIPGKDASRLKIEFTRNHH